MHDTGTSNIWRLRRECLHQRVVRNTIFRKAPPSVVSGYGKRSINLNKVVATFEKHIFLSQTDMDKRKGYDLLLINAGVRNSVSERKNSWRLLHYV
jgi:hypothetical protein